MNFKFSSGVLNEENALLGLNGGGAFEVSDSKTYFMGAEMSVKPAKRLSLSAAYYYGTSKNENKSALMRLSNVQSESVALKTAYEMSEKTTLGFRANSPLYIRKATAMFDLPVARDATQDIIYRKQVRADLHSEAREWDFSLFSTHKQDNYHFQAEGMVRINPEHQANVKNDYRLMLSFGFDY